MSKTALKHKAEAPKRLRFAIVTISSSKAARAEAGKPVEDVSGDLIAKLVEEAGHEVKVRRLIPDSPKRIKELFSQLLHSSELDVIVSTGGTGVSPADVTVETVRGLLEKELPGFGELFRFLSFQRVGSSAMLSRALAGVCGGKAVFCLPGSPDAVELALRELLLPEVGHVVKHAREH